MATEIIEPLFKVSFPGPFEHHDVVVNGWRVPLLAAHPKGEDRVVLVLDRRISLEIGIEEAERVIPFVADAIAAALGFGAHPSADQSGPLPRAAHPCPQRVREVFPAAAQ